ncbi:MAG: DNA-3-methyladenine glycosylase 2 family protein [Oscillospiraceae bacterium]|nr:DNA-3-methyladenine glycosylase 2 family protein [Oscillospiraceae bacterium]
MEYRQENGNITVTGLSCLDLKDTLDCGQAFRWREVDENTFEGMAGNRYLKIKQSENGYCFFDTTEEDFLGFWCEYFDMQTDYKEICRRLIKDPVMEKAACYAPGIRVLRQDGWEALISFIISQNNNVSRIKGIIQRLCETFGEKMPSGWYSFPTAQRLAQCSVEDLAPLRAGFRAKYIIDAAQKVASGEVDLEKIAAMTSDDAQAYLMKIKGVGVKVADCTLLYGFAKMDRFPQDVWIKRATAYLYPDGVPDFVMEHAGIAQQYIFHYARTCPQAFEGMEK